MKTEIKISIFLFICISFIAFSPGNTLCFDGYFEDFEESFPPEGWILLSENEENTWRQLTEVEYFHPDHGLISVHAETSEHFTFVGVSENEENRLKENGEIEYCYTDTSIFSTKREKLGSYLVKMVKNEGYFNELLISSIQEVTENLFYEENWWKLGIDLLYFSTAENPDYNINVAICYDCKDIKKAKWEIVISKWDFSYSSSYNAWNLVSTSFKIAQNRPFRISILFEGSTSQGFGIDFVDIYYYENGPWLGSSQNLVKGGDCSCSATCVDNRPDLILWLLFIGTFYIILRPRKNR